MHSVTEIWHFCQIVRQIEIGTATQQRFINKYKSKNYQIILLDSKDLVHITHEGKAENLADLLERKVIKKPEQQFVDLVSTLAPDELMGTFEAWHRDALARGFKGLFLINNMDWLKDIPCLFTKWFEIEKYFDACLPPANFRLLCQYEMEGFPPQFILDVLSIHSHIYNNVEDSIDQNPIYTHSQNSLYQDIEPGVPTQMSNTLKKSLAVLAENNQKYQEMIRAFFDDNEEVILLIDPKTGEIINANYAASKFYGYSRVELCSLNINQINTLPHHELVQKMESALSKKSNSFNFTHKLADGRVKDVHVSSGPIQIGDRSALYSVVHDITDQISADKEIKRQIARLHTLRQIDLAINAKVSINEFSKIFLFSVLEQLEVDAAVLYIERNWQDVEDLLLSVGQISDLTSLSNKKFFEQIVEKIYHSGRIFDCKKIIGEVEELREIFGFHEFQNIYGAPIISHGKNKAVLITFEKGELEPNSDWLGFFEILVGQCAIALQNHDLINDLVKKNDELIKAYDKTIEGWSRALDLRDQETEGHSQRVTEMTVLLANEYGIKEDQLQYIRWGALLHDIGKMGVPDRILLKPGKLTKDEWAEMKNHTIYAGNLLGPIDFLDEALDIPLFHHEHWDGRGYPYRLKGEEIPLAARIFAVVDVWDALSSDRPYRKRWAKEDVIAYIKDQSGNQFDPVVVNIFLKMLENTSIDQMVRAGYVEAPGD